MGNATAGAAYFGNEGLSITDKFQVTAAGALTATSGTIAGWAITPSNGSSEGRIYKEIPAASSGDGKRFYIGLRSDAYDSSQTVPYNPIFWVNYNNVLNFYIRSNGYLYASDANIAGIIAANTGSIGGANGWTISANKITNGTLGSDDSFHMGTHNLGTATIAGVSASSWRLAVGSNFGVTGTGALYSSNAVISGKITATSGSIANWRIEPGYLASGSATGPGTNVLLLCPSGTSSSYTVAGKTAAGWVFTSGTTFGIHRDGELYATAGQIGGLTIATNSLHTANVAITSNSDGSVGLSSANFTRTVAGASRTDLRLAIGSNFGVSNSGVLYANNVNLTGKITANEGYLGEWQIVSSQKGTGIETAICHGIDGLNPATSVNDGVYIGESMILYNSQYTWSTFMADSITCNMSAQKNTRQPQYQTVINPNAIGLYNNTTNMYCSMVVGSNEASIQTNGTVAAGGNIYVNTRNHGYYLATTTNNTSYPALFDNGSNLWIGASSTSGPHHIGGTYISAGHTGSEGNVTIYVSVPNAANNGGSNYAVLHEHNYTAYVTSAKNTENNVRRIVTTTDTESKYCSAIYTESSDALCVRGRWGGTTYVTKNMLNFGSDVRLKTNIKKTEVESALHMINSIELHSFDWIDHEEHQKIGFVADELEKLDSKFATGGGYEEDGTMNVKSVNSFYMQGYIVKLYRKKTLKYLYFKEKMKN